MIMGQCTFDHLQVSHLQDLIMGTRIGARTIRTGFALEVIYCSHHNTYQIVFPFDSRGYSDYRLQRKH